MFNPTVRKDLLNNSWIEQSNNAVKMHPLIRESIEGKMNWSYSQNKKFFESVLESYDSVIKNEHYDENSKLNICLDICKTVKIMTEKIEFDECFDDAHFNTLIDLFEYCFRHYQYKLEKDICENVLKKCMIFRFNGKTLAKFHSVAGKVYQRFADYDNAISQFGTAVNCLPDSDEVERGRMLRKLGEVYRKASKYDEALETDQKALNLLKDELDKAEAQNAIGVVFINMGQACKDEQKQNYYNQAEKWYKLADAIREKHPERPADLAFSKHNLGTVYHLTGRYKDALEKHEEGLKIRKDNHLSETEVAASYAWIGSDYLKLKEYDLAKENIDKALEIIERLLGTEHPDYAWKLNTLVTYYIETGNLEEAGTNAEKVYDIRSKVLGEEHQYTIQAKNRLEEIHEMYAHKNI